jgi:hypothetical protein
MSKHKSPIAILAVPVVAAVVLVLFAWPTARMEPRDLPIGVAGPAPAADALERRIDGQAFDVHRYESPVEAREAIEDREVYGAFVATPSGPTVLSSTAASPAVAQLLAHAATEVDAAVEDVVAAPRGAALASSVLPLVIAGILAGVAASLLSGSMLGRAGLLAAGAVGTGLAATAIVQGWLDVVGGDWLANAATLSLVVLSIGSIVAGLYALLGERGIALGVLTMVFVGNPFSAAGSAPELLPAPVGGLGQLMPPGAGANLLRSTGYFDGAAAGGHAAVLAVWALAGIALLAIAGARRTAPSARYAPA